MCKRIRNCIVYPCREACAKLRLNMLSQYRLIFNVRRLTNAVLFRAKPFVAIKRETLPCVVCCGQFPIRKIRLPCYLFLSLPVCFAVAKAVFDLSGQFSFPYIPGLPSSVFALKNVFAFFHFTDLRYCIFPCGILHFSKNSCQIHDCRFDCAKLSCQANKHV